MTQCEQIEEYMRLFGSITPAEAFNDLGVMRLASRICDMRKAGIQILAKNETKKNRFGRTCTYKRYSLVGVENGRH